MDALKPPCPAVLMIAGVSYRCDWDLRFSDGRHPGWGHTNKEACALWLGTVEDERLLDHTLGWMEAER